MIVFLPFSFFFFTLDFHFFVLCDSNIFINRIFPSYSFIYCLSIEAQNSTMKWCKTVLA